MKQYLKLLLAREAKEVVGKKGTNMWLLTLVLVATFASIAFSKGSMVFLQDKMEDPFTNWIDIPIDGTSVKNKEFLEELNKEDIQRKFGFTDVHGDREHYYDMVGKKDMYLRCRHFADISSPLVRKILDKENIIGGCVADSNKIHSKSLGVFITADALKRMGYPSDSIPAFIHYKAYVPQGDTLGLNMIDGNFFLEPWPILAVVRRLPGNADMMGTNFLSEQPNNDNSYPFDFNVHKEYIEKLSYFVPEGIENNEIVDVIKRLLPDTLAEAARILNCNYTQMQTWKPGHQIEVSFGQSKVSLSTSEWIKINENVLSKLGGKGVTRIYDYMTSDYFDIDSYLSLTFTTLDHIRDFENFAKSDYHIQIDMSQVASKENFNAVTIMAGILSAAMVIFSIVCIIMFMVNMLQSYFQKVKRNIGTFKAFGMNGRELIWVYVLILVMIVFASVVLALLITWSIQGLLPILGIQKDGFNYLSLWNTTTYVATIVIFVSTIFTVIIVMTRLLSQTPGDLIYDRN